MYNHYQGNTGVVRRGPEPSDRARFPSQEPPPQGLSAPAPPRPVNAPPPVSRRPPSPLSGLSGELGRLLSRLSPLKLETDDLLLILILYLMYRESRDEELLYILAAMFFM